MVTRYVVFNNGYRTVFEREFQFISQIINLLKSYSSCDDKDYTYSLKGDELDDDPDYDYRMIFTIGYK